ncbi:VOC family protein [Ekhidna sp.]|uniref:VOC family protein n=1 Tax=Ekhidna sp. TaxID=2608089 RepID=UPI003C7B8610
MAKAPFPTNDMALTTILVVSNMTRSKKFYQKVLGAEIFREYGGDSCVLKFLDNWILLVTSGGETIDKPNTQFVPPKNSNLVSHSFTIRVKDCMGCYETLKERGANFLTPPVNWGQEIRAFFKDPDGHLFKISEA